MHQANPYRFFNRLVAPWLMIALTGLGFGADGPSGARPELQSYLAHIAAAQALLRLNETAAARRWLDQAPEPHRNWEWRYLMRKAEGARAGADPVDQATSVYAAILSPSGSMLTLASVDQAAIQITKPDATPIHLSKNNQAVWSLAFSPNGKTLATTSSDRTVTLWDADRAQVRQSLTGHEAEVTAVSFGPKGDRLVSASNDGAIRLWLARTGELSAILRGHGGGVSSVAFSPESGSVASASADGAVKIWDLAQGRERFTLDGNEPHAVAYSPDGKRLVSSSKKGPLMIWEAASGRLLITLTGHTAAVTALAYSPNGQFLASASNDRTVRLWEPARGKALRVMALHQAAATCVAFSPDGTRIVSGGHDSTTRLWDVAGGDNVLTFAGYAAPVYAAGFSPDGSRLAISLSNGSVLVYDAMSKRARLKKRAPRQRENPNGETRR